MTVSAVLDAAGRRRSPATLPGCHAGRAPSNKGQRYPADPPTVEEIITVMRDTPDDRHGARLGAMIVVPCAAGCASKRRSRSESATSNPAAAALLIRSGKGGQRREVGMDDWGWEHLSPWVTKCVELPPGPLFSIIAGPTRGRPWPQTGVPEPAPPTRRPGRRAQARRAAPAPPRPGRRAGARGRTAERDPAPARPFEPRRHLHLPARDRQRRGHQRRPHPQAADDPGSRRTNPLTSCVRPAGTSGPWPIRCRPLLLPTEGRRFCKAPDSIAPPVRSSSRGALLLRAWERLRACVGN
jgi:hypothetical protein